MSPLAFGKDVRKEFLFDPDYHNLNHGTFFLTFCPSYHVPETGFIPTNRIGSFGAIPSYIQGRLQYYQNLYNRRPDEFMQYEYPRLLDENRQAIAELVNAPHADEVVLVANATTAVNVVLRGLAEAWSADGRDEILYFSTVYGSCGETIDYVVDSTYGRVSSRAIDLIYPLPDSEIIARFRAAVQHSREVEGKRPRVAVFDVVSSNPGVRFPFEAITSVCRELGILSLVDGAHGVGMIDLDMTSLDPDFFVSNCHKWLFVPRGSAVFYVPRRNQHLLRSTVPTSHGSVPRGRARASPLPPSSKTAFVKNFEFVGTLDNSPYLCVRDAIEWRQRVLGGEKRIRAYTWALANSGGRMVAEALGTYVMENEEGHGSLADCAMVNIALPLVVASGSNEDESSLRREADVNEAVPMNISGINGNSEGPGREMSVKDGETIIHYTDAEKVWEWMNKALLDDYQTSIPTYTHGGRFWARLSAQVYLDINDFEWAGKALKMLCERVAKKEYKYSS